MLAGYAMERLATARCGKRRACAADQRHRVSSSCGTSRCVRRMAFPQRAVGQPFHRVAASMADRDRAAGAYQHHQQGRHPALRAR